MNHVEMRNLSKSYGAKKVLDNLNLELERAELVALLGPSGCGKSTTLKILAGLESADQGSINVDGNEISKLPTNKRNMGIVFQSYSLFPHLNAVDNVAYGLKIRGMNSSARRKRAEELLELVGLTEHMEKFPAKLSGGQQQRVALARALAIEPQVLLLDEPLSALDAKVRTQLRDEIRRIQLTQGITTLLVTHDQEEALVMADRVGVMNAGIIEQIGTPSELYHEPKTPFISQFVGVVNRIPGRYSSGSIEVLGKRIKADNPDIKLPEGSTAVALIRPEEISISPSDLGEFSVISTQLRGVYTSILASGPSSDYIRVDVPSTVAGQFAPGMTIDLKIERTHAVLDRPSAAEQTEDRTNPSERGSHA